MTYVYIDKSSSIDLINESWDSGERCNIVKMI